MCVHVHDILILIVSEWSSKDVVEKYLKPINMGHLEKTFVENNISGAVLMVLEVKGCDES